MMIRELAPTGLRGLLLVTFAAAFMSTISTQMNWGASYLVNDLYRRFVAPTADDRELLTVSRLASALVLLLGGAVGWFMVANGISVDDAWSFLAAMGAGVGTVFILRWFWWRINVWSEIWAMVGSLAVFTAFRLAVPGALGSEYRSLLVALITMGIWLTATFATQPEPQAHLVAFYARSDPPVQAGPRPPQPACGPRAGSAAASFAPRSAPR